MTVSKSYQQFASEGCPIEFYQKIATMFSKTKTFCFENSVSHTWLRHA